MKISSYLERRRKWRSDYYKTLVFLNFESEWTYHDKMPRKDYRNGIDIYDIEHKNQNITIWVSNGIWATHFNIGDTIYQQNIITSILLGWCTPWKRKLYRRAYEVAQGGHARDGWL